MERLAAGELRSCRAARAGRWPCRKPAQRSARGRSAGARRGSSAGRCLVDPRAVPPDRDGDLGCGHSRHRARAMHVIATAGHVDHGKSTLVRALTGMEPDRLEEERRRGLTIELGFVWTSLPTGTSRWPSSTFRAITASCRRCLPASARCPRPCSWSPPTAAGRRRPPSTSPRWMPWVSGTAWSPSPAAIWPTRRRFGPRSSDRLRRFVVRWRRTRGYRRLRAHR